MSLLCEEEHDSEREIIQLSSRRIQLKIIKPILQDINHHI